MCFTPLQCAPARLRTHDDVITPCLSQHVGDQFGRDGRSRLVLLVLPRIGEMRHDRGDPPGRGDLARVDHDTELEQRRVDHPCAGVHDVDVIVSYGFLDLDLALPRGRLCDLGLGEGDPEAVTIRRQEPTRARDVLSRNSDLPFSDQLRQFRVTRP